MIEPAALHFLALFGSFLPKLSKKYTMGLLSKPSCVFLPQRSHAN